MDNPNLTEMKIRYFDDYSSLTNTASLILIDDIRAKKDLLICAATGGSPTGLYGKLAEEFKVNSILFSNIRILKLDEWGGIPMNDPNTCHSYLQKHVITPLKIDNSRYIAFDNSSINPEEECKRIQKEIETRGPIDVCILGLGKNGHLGLNEPADFLHKDCHIARLTESTMQHSMAQSMINKPSFGMTVGIKDILQSKKILLLITGQQKQDSIRRFLTGDISTQLPASFLWLHSNVECLIDKTSC
jgi:galactosamine-6-phosphate isomerase